MDILADDVIALLDALQIEQAVIGGLSMGGYVAFNLFQRYRPRVRALLLADTRAAADTADGRTKRDELIALARARGSGAVADKQVTGLIGKSTRAKQPELVDRIRAIMTEASVDGIVGALEAMKMRADSTSLLASVDVPTLVVVGDEDVVTPVKEARAMQRQIAGSRLEVVPGAGHLSNVERPAAFNAALSDFVGSLIYN
jgi:pimeloyl-ACP methyl ester carboxylesterase